MGYIDGSRTTLQLAIVVGVLVGVFGCAVIPAHRDGRALGPGSLTPSARPYDPDIPVPEGFRLADQSGGPGLLPTRSQSAGRTAARQACCAQGGSSTGPPGPAKTTFDRGAVKPLCDRENSVSPPGKLGFTGPTYLRHRYQGRAQKQAVRDFYLKQMPLVRWTPISENHANGRITMRFARGTQECTVTIADDPMRKSQSRPQSGFAAAGMGVVVIVDCRLRIAD